ncbi:hypothetical protein AHF37_04437 [Paragonimus kellicotti]|nr:hypothetical protein AHF37_04437 [Paragonimus kellicotti]
MPGLTVSVQTSFCSAPFTVARVPCRSLQSIGQGPVSRPTMLRLIFLHCPLIWVTRSAPAFASTNRGSRVLDTRSRDWGVNSNIGYTQHMPSACDAVCVEFLTNSNGLDSSSAGHCHLSSIWTHLACTR